MQVRYAYDHCNDSVQQIAVVAGRRVVCLLGDDGVSLFDLLRCRSVLVILAATGAVPVFDIALVILFLP